MKSPSKICICSYPERVRIGDDKFGNRLLYCINHGFSTFRPKNLDRKYKRTILLKIPTLVWVKSEKREKQKREKARLM